MPQEPPATLVITTRNRREELLKALASAVTQTVPLEIIVLDDASEDGTGEAVAAAFPQARLIRNKTCRGYIRLRNEAAELARAPYIFSIDDDAVFTSPRIVEQTLREFDHPRVGAVAIPFINVSTSPEVLQRAPGDGGVHVAHMFIGTAHALRRDVFLRLGGYRAFLEHQCEEPDYCARMLAAGYVVRLGGADPIHHFASPKRDYARIHFYGARNDVLRHWLNVPWPNVVWRMLRTTLGHLLDGLRRGSLGAQARGLAAGWLGAYRHRRERAPLDAVTYRLLNRIANQPRPLGAVEPLLPPIALGAPLGGLVRVAWLIRGDEGFGVAQAVRGLTGGVAALGIGPVLLSLTAGPFARERGAAGLPVVALDLPLPPRLGSVPGKRVIDYWRLRRYQKRAYLRVLGAVRALHPSALHVLWPDLMPLAGAVARGLGIACCWEMPNAIRSRRFLPIGRMVFQREAARYGITVLANSRYTAGSFGGRPVRPRLLYPGVDTARFDPATAGSIRRVDLGMPSEAIVFGMFGRLEPSKGQDRVLRAVAGLARDYPLHLLLVGVEASTRDFAAKLQAAAAAACLPDRLHLVGVVGAPERYYGAVDVAVSATVGPESFGFSVVEAMAMEKPVLVHALGGPAETVLDGVTGWHVRTPSVEALRAGLLRALADRPRWAEMGAAGRRRALERYSLVRQARRYAQVFLALPAPLEPRLEARSRNER